LASRKLSFILAADTLALALLSHKIKRDHVCAICDGYHELTLAGFGNTSHVSRQVRARTRMIPADGHEKEFGPWFS